MFTYIINTSENKTFDCDNLIRLVKYNKIQWIYQRLDKLEEVAKEIYEKQNTLDAEDFRIVVLIDFFGFDRVRKPYSKSDYQVETGVDVNLYIPFIQTYVFDHLFNYLENKDLWAHSWDIYYIQNEKYEHFDSLDNASEQITRVLSPIETSEGIILPEDFYQDEYVEDKASREVLGKEIEKLKKEVKRIENDIERYNEYKVKSKDLRLKEKELVELDKKIAKEYINYRYCYGEYELYCTHNYSLKFNLSSYPYNSFVKSHDVEITDQIIENSYDKYIKELEENAGLVEVNKIKKDDKLEQLRFNENKKLTLEEFYSAFLDRVNLHKYRVNSHYYVIGYSTSPAKSAFDSLSLSLYLIRAFEREEEVVSIDQQLENAFVGSEYNKRNSDKAIKLNQQVLVESLVSSWNKINSAREVAKKANIEYYDILEVAKGSIASQYLDRPTESEDEIKNNCRTEVINQIAKGEITIPDNVDSLYIYIDSFKKAKGKMSSGEQKELNELFNNYIKARDSVDESSIDEILLQKSKTYPVMNQCPSKSHFDQADEIEQNNIRDLFKKAFGTNYIEVDYSSERAFAKEQQQEYKNLEKKLRGKRGNFVIMTVALLLMMIPYIFITTDLSNAFIITKVYLYLETLAFLAGLYVLIYFIKIAPIKKQMNIIKEKLKGCYEDCLVKQKMSLFGYRKMYEKDLLTIEKVRYERRNLLKLYQYNQKLNANVEQHRRQLEKMEESLSTMLNNLGIQPIVNIDEESVKGEFNLEKSITSPENNIYKVFSLETIDKLFEKSWEDQ